MMKNNHRSRSLRLCSMLLAFCCFGLTATSVEAARWWTSPKSKATDTTAPTLAIISPRADSVFRSAQTVVVEAVAQDEVGVARVEFYRGNILFGTDTSWPYSASFPVTASLDGSHRVTAKAFDAAGNSAVSDPIDISVQIGSVLTPLVAVNAPGQLEFSAAAYSVNEGAGQIELAINRSGGSDGAVSVQWRTQTFDGYGTADWAKDYGTIYPARTLNFAAGEKSKTISIAISQDSEVEGDETFTVLLENAGGGATLGAKTSAIVTIKDDDRVPAVAAPAPGMLELSAATYSVSEGAGKVDIVVNRSGGSDGAVSVQWRTQTFDGFGTADWAKDYGTVYPARTLSFAAGEKSKTISIAISQDSEVEGDETFTVLLENAGGGAALGAKTRAIVTIKDDDVASGQAPAVSVTPFPLQTSGPLRVFPGAQGFGTQTPAGRGGQILKVTNLNDSGTGSLRAALAASGARIIVFEVGGSINLGSSINIANPFVTIAGQTAPAPGIMLRGGGLNINTHDVLVQHLAIRPGANASDPMADGISINNSQGWNIVLDHLSLQWAPDEQISTWIAPHDITVSNSIIAEGMGEKHGMLIGDCTKNVTLMGNLFAHNGDRNPAQKGDTSVVYANNLVYNPGGWEHYYFSDNGYNDSDGDGFSGPVVAALVGNVFKDGLDSGKIYTGLGVAKVAPGSKVYQANNARNTGPVFTSATASAQAATSPIDLSGYRVESNLSMVELDVLSYAGTRPAQRDAVDGRIVNDVKSGKGTIPTLQPAYPTYPSTSRAFQIPADPNGDYDGNGYTNIEEVLHQMAAQVEGRY